MVAVLMFLSGKYEQQKIKTPSFCVAELQIVSLLAVLKIIISSFLN